MRPLPAPTTWMMAAHSALCSMSAAEAFCTLRILPRIGSKAWFSLLRAFLAVPSAESPSTINSSDVATSSLRQSASLAGRVEVSSAVLRRVISLCIRALTRARISPTIFSCRARAWALRSRLGLLSTAVSSFSTTAATMARTGAVPRTSLVCPSNCGSGTRTVTTAVRPAKTSSFSILPSREFSFKARELALICLRITLTTACSKPLR